MLSFGNVNKTKYKRRKLNAKKEIVDTETVERRSSCDPNIWILSFWIVKDFVVVFIYF